MYDIKEIAQLINGKIRGNTELSFTRIAPFFHSTEKELTFAADEKMLKNIDKCIEEAWVAFEEIGLYVG